MGKKNRSKKSINHKIKCDDCNKIWVENYNWFLCSSGYAVRSFTIAHKRKRFSLHKLIMWAPEGMEIDHINGDKLDSRYGNLRVATKQQNGMNQGLAKNNKSGHKGVAWRKQTRKWSATIIYKYENIWLGGYDKKEDAIKARLTAEKEIYGEYSRQMQK